MKRNLKFILTLLKLKLSHMMVFRLSFFGGFLIDGTLFLTQLLMFQAIYGQVDSIGGWSKGQMMIFVGTFSLLNAINMTVYFFGVNDIPSKIKSGELDHYITKPVNPLLRLTFENVNPGSAPLILMSFCIIGYGISLHGESIAVHTWVLYTLFVLLMALLYYDVEVLLRTIPFFVISAESISSLEGTLLDFCMKMPGVIFRGAFKVLFYLIIPYGIMSTVPTQILTQAISPSGILYSAAIVFFFTVLTLKFWKFGLRHYKSASS